MGGNRAPSNWLFVKLRGRRIEGEERAQLRAGFFFFFLFLSYIMYFLLRYKNLHAELAMA